MTASADGLAQNATPRSADKGHHFGEKADPSVWPISSVGTVTILWHANIKVQCTGTLVAPRAVLTAGHCLFLGQEVAAPANVHFSAGLDKGVPAAHSIAERFEISQSYRPDEDRALTAAGSDWALVFLKDPLSLRPVGVHSPTAEDVRAISASKSATQVGYGRDRPYLPSIVRDCEISEGPSVAVFLYKCLANFGYSGAPIFAEFDGQPAIVGIGSRGHRPDVDNPLGVACSATQFADRVAQAVQQK